MHIKVFTKIKKTHSEQQIHAINYFVIADIYMYLIIEFLLMCWYV